MKVFFLACVFFSITLGFATAGDEETKLPEGALTLEMQPVAPNRSLILWMVRPTKNPRETPDEPYTCPEYTRGNYYTGATRVSLVDSQTRRVINTVKISPEPGEGADEFDIPYHIRSDHYYRVAGVPKETEGKPTIMWLKDYNGDGKALEFVLFDAQACMGLATTLIGFSERQDKVIQYQTHLAATDPEGKRSSTIQFWVDYLFARKSMKPGSWKYEIDYRGRGGSLDKYEIHYNKQAEKFEGKLRQTNGE